jgi:secondary thiamine-phosphate synthase enzyme
VRSDMHHSLENMVPENQEHFKHVQEGSDDMPGHIKSAMIGHQITIPITKKTLCMGTWQGIYFYEFRNHGGSRRILVTQYS